MINQKALHNHIQKIRRIATFQEITQLPHEQYITNVSVAISVTNIVISALLILYLLIGLALNQFVDIPYRIMTLLVLPGVYLVANIWGLKRITAEQTNQAANIIIVSGFILIMIAVLYSGGLFSSAILGLVFMFVTGMVLTSMHLTITLFIVIISYFLILFTIEQYGLLSTSQEIEDPLLHLIALTTAVTGLLGIITYHKYALLESGRRTAKLEAEQARLKIQNELTQNLAHDLRTPMSVVKSSMYLIQRRNAAGLPLHQTLTRVERAVDNMHFMLEDLLALTMLDDLTPTHEADKIHVETCIANSIAHVKDYAAQQKTTIEFISQAPPETYIWGDDQQLKQAIYNLLENAVHHGGNNGQVRVGLSCQYTSVAITVTDNGRGIPPEYHDKIFERFFRVNEARTMGGRQGTGIGLNIVKKIITLHQGEISLESESGIGTTFTITLPKTHPETPPT